MKLGNIMITTTSSFFFRFVPFRSVFDCLWLAFALRAVRCCHFPFHIRTPTAVDAVIFTILRRSIRAFTGKIIIVIVKFVATLVEHGCDCALNSRRLRFVVNAMWRDHVYRCFLFPSLPLSLSLFLFFLFLDYLARIVDDVSFEPFELFVMR